jgi:hypothetical protein
MGCFPIAIEGEPGAVIGIIGPVRERIKDRLTDGLWKQAVAPAYAALGNHSVRQDAAQPLSPNATIRPSRKVGKTR